MQILLILHSYYKKYLSVNLSLFLHLKNLSILLQCVSTWISMWKRVLTWTGRRCCSCPITWVLPGPLWCCSRQCRAALTALFSRKPSSPCLLRATGEKRSQVNLHANTNACLHSDYHSAFWCSSFICTVQKLEAGKI